MEPQMLASKILPMLAQTAITITDTVAVEVTKTPKDLTAFYIAIAAVMIALFAVGISAYEAWANREHNRLSVR